MSIAYLKRIEEYVLEQIAQSSDEPFLITSADLQKRLRLPDGFLGELEKKINFDPESRIGCKVFHSDEGFTPEIKFWVK